MTYEDRKVVLIRKHKTIAGLAAAYTKKTGLVCRREEMSMCITGARIYPALREFLAQQLGYTVEQLFGTKKVRKAA